MAPPKSLSNRSKAFLISRTSSRVTQGETQSFGLKLILVVNKNQNIFIQKKSMDQISTLPTINIIFNLILQKFYVKPITIQPPLFFHLSIISLKLFINSQFEPRQMNNSANLQNELQELFNSILVDKSKEAAVQKSTLLSLLIYHQVDQQYPEYFRYLSRTLEQINKTLITQEEFFKIFMHPDIDLAMGDKNELADAFSILDPNKTGSIDVNQFLEVYRQSQNYQKLPKQKQDQAEDEIKQAFYSASQDGKITPMDFYHIVKFR